MNELHGLAASGLLTASLWMVYVRNRLVVVGLRRTMGNRAATDPPLAPWARRAQAAHRNAVENLAVFSALLLAAVALDLDGDLTRSCAMAPEAIAQTSLQMTRQHPSAWTHEIDLRPAQGRF
jgi:uncharacterized MAPEG superfamily protein